MQSRYISLVISAVLLFVNSCRKNDEKFDHPLDPGSTAYISPTHGLIIDDYNDMERITAPIYRNPWGLEPFVFPLIAPKDTVVTFSFECNHFVTLRWHGCSLKIKFDIRSFQSQDFGGWGQRLGDTQRGYYFDATVPKFTKLTFWFKGAMGGEVFEIGLHDSADFESDKYNITKDFVRVTTEWQKAKIPLDSLTDGSKQGVRGKVNLKALENVNIGFNRTLKNLRTGEDSPLIGIIYIDDLAFER